MSPRLFDAYLWFIEKWSRITGQRPPTKHISAWFIHNYPTMFSEPDPGKRKDILKMAVIVRMMYDRPEGRMDQYTEIVKEIHYDEDPDPKDVVVKVAKIYYGLRGRRCPDGDRIESQILGDLESNNKK